MNAPAGEDVGEGAAQEPAVFLGHLPGSRIDRQDLVGQFPVGREVAFAAGLDSSRALAYIRDVLRSLAPYASARQAGELTEYAAGRLPGLRRA